MNHHVSTDVFGCEYASVQRNREAAIKALAAMPPKPIRIMVPADFAPKEDTRRGLICEHDRERKRLELRCVKELEDQGSLSTADIGRILRVSTQAIAHALTGCAEVSRVEINERDRKTGKTVSGWLWSIVKGDNS